MKKIVIIDVGTHTGQEYKAIFQHSIIAYLIKFIKIWIASFLYKEKLDTINIAQAISIIKESYRIRSKRNMFKIIFVEPNTRLLRNKIYNFADMVFCIALGGNEKAMSLRPLFFQESDYLGQGSSLFDNKKGVDQNNCDYVVRCSADYFSKSIKNILDSDIGQNKYQVILRINCEGSEDEVIYAFNKTFSHQFQLVLGSLKDVLELKGDDASKTLNNFIKDENIKFVPFSSSYRTWSAALVEINKYLLLKG